MEKLDFYLMAGIGFGIYGFFWGFMRLRRKRRIENTPTSTVRAMAMGLTELIGRARKDPPLIAPLSNAKCAYYRFLVERYEQRGRNSRWVTIATGNSARIPFWLDDDTGKVMIVPEHAEFECSVRYKYQTGLGGKLPQNLIDFLEKKHIRHRGFLGHHPLRFREWYIGDGDKVYVLGTAAKNRDCIEEHRQKLAVRLQQLKGDKEKMAKIDLDSDGTISSEEWSMAVASVEQELLEEELHSAQGSLESDVVITRGELDKLFLISDHDEKELVKKLSGQVILGVWGGVALALACLAILLYRIL